MWDASPSAPQYLQYTAICQHGMEHCTVSRQASTGPHRPGYHMGPTSGGSIGSQGMGDPVYLFVLYAVVPAIQGHRAECYGIVVYLTGLRTWPP